MVTNAAQRQRYHTSLQALHAECETNYLRLLKILPDFNTEDSRHLSLQTGSGQERRFQFFIFERARYTTTLDIAEFGAHQQWGLSASFSVRLYHDARMAEVLAFQRERNVAPFNHYPNSRMFQPDEKIQWNFLLGEWLTHCLLHGYNTGKAFVPCTAGDCV
ncbi:MAG TPA: DUF1249 domain-containing protein [Pseudomonadales bacterium]|nr:DUF1249 domain-containing protein [Pseudomonadales bacterium]